MFSSFKGVVVSTVPRVVIWLENGQRIAADRLRKVPFNAGIRVDVLYNFNEDKIGEIIPTGEEESASCYTPLNILQT